MEELAECLDCCNDLLKYRGSIVELIGDCPNVEMGVNPESIFWKTIAVKAGWECQVHVVSHKARIVSPDHVCKGNGSRNAMLEKLDRLTDQEFMRRGDVIGISRNGLYEHYAIYLGNGRVIHYCGEGDDFGGRITIHESPLSDFLKGSRRSFVVWFDGGKPVKLQNTTSFLFYSAVDIYDEAFGNVKRRTYSAEETVARAYSRIGEERYSLVSNNCEHFAMWCKTGVSESSQVEAALRFACKPDTCCQDMRHNVYCN